MQIAEKLAKLTALEDTLFNYKEANIVPQPNVGSVRASFSGQTVQYTEEEFEVFMT